MTDPSTEDTSTQDRWQEQVIVWGVGIALAYGAFAQGGFYSAQFFNVLIAVVVALGARVLLGGPWLPRSLAVSVVAFVGLGAWAFINGLIVGVPELGGPTIGLPHLALCLAITALIVAVHHLSEDKRTELQLIMVVIAVLVAATAWVGAVWHLEALAMPSQGLWRGASTLTYANAAAAFLVLPMLFVAVEGVRTHRAPLFTAVLYVLGVGWISTLSRGSFLAVVVAVVVGLVFFPQRKRLLRLWPLLPAWGVAFVASLPSLAEGAEPKPFVALLGVGVGAAIAVGGRHNKFGARIVAMLLAIGVVVGVALSVTVMRDVWTQVADTRLNAASSDRDDLARVTFEQFTDAPLIGVGAGQIDFQYENSAGVLVQAWYTHNEYLQLAAELGLVGVVLLVVAVVALLKHLHSSRRDNREYAAVALAGTAAMIVHSSLDFLWHIPIFVLFTITGTLVFRRPLHAGPEKDFRDS